MGVGHKQIQSKQHARHAAIAMTTHFQKSEAHARLETPFIIYLERM